MRSLKTVEQIYAEQVDWFSLHQPFDRDVIAGNHEFIARPMPENCALVPLNNNPNRLALDIMPHAYKQLMAKIGYPENIFSKLPEKLNYANINWLIQQHYNSDQLLLRCQDNNKIRAIQSDRYQQFDDITLIDLVMPYMQGGVVRWDYDDEQTFHLSVSFPNLAEEIKVGDVVERGIHISNSEVGMRSVTIAGYLYRLICTNGAISKGKGGDSFRFYHVGDGSRIKNAVKEAIESVHMHTTGLIKKFKQALNVSISNPVNELEDFCRKSDVTQKDYKEMLNAMFGSGEDLNNLYGYVQGISSYANQLEGEKAFEVQNLTVKALDMGLLRKS